MFDLLTTHSVVTEQISRTFMLNSFRFLLNNIWPLCEGRIRPKPPVPGPGNNPSLLFSGIHHWVPSSYFYDGNWTCSTGKVCTIVTIMSVLNGIMVLLDNATNYALEMYILHVFNIYCMKNNKNKNTVVLNSLTVKPEQNQMGPEETYKNPGLSWKLRHRILDTPTLLVYWLLFRLINLATYCSVLLFRLRSALAIQS